MCICVFVFLYLDARHLGTLFLRSSYHYLFKNITHVRSIFKFNPNCICVFAFVYLGVRHLGTLFLRSSYHFLFKNISHHGYFQGFSDRELCGAYKWDGLGMGLGSLCGVIIWAPLCGANKIRSDFSALAAVSSSSDAIGRFCWVGWSSKTLRRGSGIATHLVTPHFGTRFISPWTS